ncbi:MAG: 5-(carboxyamino)imidazole ribonucleotide synthase [Opitutales bacterium]|nr:5-(carboxyamino)imidazole ribonucleotide synthase [Opitutales bacterium]MCH8540706.1 5-(carboxyamino)imidazole ribonucleotide synthase [Opitutales bacterium]
MSLPPGQIIGILGGGQLGRMTALAARPLGYRIHIYDPNPDCPAAPVADHVVTGAFTDTAKIKSFTKGVDVLTFEFENVDTSTLYTVAPSCPIRPSLEVLDISRDREKEKTFFRDQGFPCADFAIVDSPQSLASAAERIGFPCVLKTATMGYDGKGQIKLQGPFEAEKVWSELGAPRAILEQWVEFTLECSVIVALSPSGETACFDPAENIHRHHILHQSIVPGRFPKEVAEEAQNLALRLARAMKVEGLLAIEMFLTKEGGLLLNETAPRPHNSGHHTIEATLTSQFEQHVRAVTDLPLGNPALRHPVVMTNLLGDLWPAEGSPDWKTLLREPHCKLHLYGKAQARPGRKMGHFTTFSPKLDSPAPIKTANQLFRQLEK